jgi:cellulose synthase/poly-beta-1,6-N-acetylglucosamine synthase-like glycosyltransferase
MSRCKEGTAWFLLSGYKFYRSRACRDTSLIGAGKVSRYRIFVRGTGAVSRYKYDRNQKPVTVQDLYCGQVRVSGCKIWQDLSWWQGFAKTMTSPLIIPSVLAAGVVFYYVPIILYTFLSYSFSLFIIPIVS